MRAIPVAAAIASTPLLSWAPISAVGMVAILGCSQVWLATSIPAAAMRRAAAGSAATLLPIRKNVALAPRSVSVCNNRSVNGVGPSSNVSATHL